MNTNDVRPLKRAVSLVLRNDSGEFLIVKRPNSATDDLAGVWGFPAVQLIDEESEIDGAYRCGRAKLGVDVILGQKIGESTHERPSQILTLSDYEATLARDNVPIVPQPDTTLIQYEACIFTHDYTLLYPAARKGSQCTQIFLESVGADWR